MGNLIKDKYDGLITYEFNDLEFDYWYCDNDNFINIFDLRRGGDARFGFTNIKWKDGRDRKERHSL